MRHKIGKLKIHFIYEMLHFKNTQIFKNNSKQQLKTIIKNQKNNQIENESITKQKLSISTRIDL